MADKKSQFRGMLLGLAVGDAMGYTIDGSSWPEIQRSYGPNGLLGYDLVNGYADVTSYTQLAAFTCNGLLLGLTRGQMTGKMLPQGCGQKNKETGPPVSLWQFEDYSFSISSAYRVLMCCSSISKSCRFFIFMVCRIIPAKKA